MREKKKLFTRRGIAMYNKRSYPLITALLLIFLLLFGTSDSVYAVALEWNTFLGGSGAEWGNAIAVDSSGNTYVTGFSSATWGSPMRAYTAGSDAFVAKLDSSGALVWNTFLGGSGADFGTGIAVDDSGNIYVTGQSEVTWGLPMRAYTAGGDAFVAKLNSMRRPLSGIHSLAALTRKIIRSLTIDSNGNIYVDGYGYANWGSPFWRIFIGDIAPFLLKTFSSSAPCLEHISRRQRGEYGLGYHCG